jgi:hypothetical protein
LRGYLSARNVPVTDFVPVTVDRQSAFNRIYLLITITKYHYRATSLEEYSEDLFDITKANSQQI